MAFHRPIKYSELIAARVCEMAAEGKSLRAICDADGMPTESRVMGWVMYPDRYSTHDFSQRFTDSRRIGWMLMGEQIIDQADDSSQDIVEKTVITRSGQAIVVKSDNPMALARAKLSIETKKWVLSKVLPNVYGDKLKVEHDISDDLAARLAAAQARLDKIPAQAPVTQRQLEESLVAVEKLESDSEDEDEEDSISTPIPSNPSVIITPVAVTPPKIESKRRNRIV